MSDKRIIKDVVEDIKKCAQAYYEGNPIVSDDEFDKKVEALRNLDPNNEILTTVGWGYDPTKSLGEKLYHKYGIIGSIDRKPKRIEDIPMNFNIGRDRISAKLDGLSGASFQRSPLFVHYPNLVYPQGIS